MNIAGLVEAEGKEYYYFMTTYLAIDGDILHKYKDGTYEISKRKVERKKKK